jgi:hypothetical protein
MKAEARIEAYPLTTKLAPFEDTTLFGRHAAARASDQELPNRRSIDIALLLGRPAGGQTGNGVEHFRRAWERVRAPCRRRANAVWVPSEPGWQRVCRELLPPIYIKKRGGNNLACLGRFLGVSERHALGPKRFVPCGL